MLATVCFPHFSRPRRRGQRGVALVEFAFISLIFFTLLLGIMEFGRWMFTFNAAGEATRLGAHLAAVCNMDAVSKTNIRTRMSFILPGVTETGNDSEISISYAPAGCDVNTCETVLVKVANLSFTPLIPFFGVEIPLPPFATSLPRELMKSVVDGVDNSACLSPS